MSDFIKLFKNIDIKKVLLYCAIILVLLLISIAPFRMFFKYNVYDILHQEPKFFFNQGVKYEEKKYFNYSIGSFKRALQIRKGQFNIQPNNLHQMESLFNIGVIYYKYKKEYIKSLFYFNKYLEVIERFQVNNPHEKDIYKVINFILSMDDTTKNAQAKRIKAEGNEAYFKKDYKTALKHYKKALTMDPGYVEVYNNIATTYFQLKDFKRAVDYWKLTLLLTPEELDIYINIALAYETQLIKPMEAIKYYEKLLSKIPGNDKRVLEAKARIKRLKDSLK